MTSHDRNSRIAGLAALVEELSKRGVRVRGKKALQKLLFLAQDRGWPTSFNFRLHFYGPYSDEADAITDLLQADGVLRRDVQGDIVPGDIVASVGKAFVRSAAAKNAAAEIARLFGDDDPMTLELLATIKYMWDSERVLYRKVAPSAVVKRVAKYKGPKFDEAQIKSGIKRLQRSRLVA
jgi:uncharacterized protein YwgA